MQKNTILEPRALFKFCPKCGSQLIDTHDNTAIKCKACHFVYYFNASGAVIVVLVNEKSELLVTERAYEPFKGKLDLPGGFITPGESAEEALIREVKEELNIDIYDLEYCFTLPNKYPFSGMYVNTVDLIFKAKTNGLHKISVADDVSDYFFIKPEDIKPGDFGIDSVREAVLKIFVNGAQK